MVQVGERVIVKGDFLIQGESCSFVPQMKVYS